MHIYKSSSGLVIDREPLGYLVATMYPEEGLERNSLRFPPQGEPAWKTASWIAKCMDSDAPWVDLNRRFLLANGVFVHGDVVCVPPDYSNDVLQSIWVLNLAGFMMDVTGDSYP